MCDRIKKRERERKTIVTSRRTVPDEWDEFNHNKRTLLQTGVVLKVTKCGCYLKEKTLVKGLAKKRKRGTSKGSSDDSG